MGESGLYSSFIPAAMTMMGAFSQANGYSAAGDAARLAGQRKAALDQFSAQQLTVNAGQSIAASQRVAADVNLSTTLTLSHARAMAAASGAGATDPTVVNLVANLAGQGAYKANLALYEGEDKARSLRMQAAADTYQASLDIEAGNDKGSAFDTQAKSSLINGGASLFSKYGFGSKTATGDGLKTPAGGGQTDAYAVGGYGT